MNVRVDGDPQKDEDFREFLDKVDLYATNYRLLDNVDHELLKRALVSVNVFVGQLQQACFINLEQQIGSVKGELRKFKNKKV